MDKIHCNLMRHAKMIRYDFNARYRQVSDQIYEHGQGSQYVSLNVGDLIIVLGQITGTKSIFFVATPEGITWTTCEHFIFCDEDQDEDQQEYR